MVNATRTLYQLDAITQRRYCSGEYCVISVADLSMRKPSYLRQFFNRLARRILNREAEESRDTEMSVLTLDERFYSSSARSYNPGHAHS